MKIGPKYKICRRLGENIFEKCQTQKFAVRSQQKNKRRRRRRLSDYGKQLLEKQKARLTYGLTERQFRRYVKEAINDKQIEPVQSLYHRLEERLDNVIYRLGFASTRRMARQIASHGHFTVNGKKSTIPSQRIELGDSLSITERSLDSKLFDLPEEDREQADWLNFNRKKNTGGIKELPTYMKSQELFDLNAVIEFYSR